MKKTKLILSALIALSVLAVLAFSGCSEPDPEYTVKYEITGPATVMRTIIFYNETGALDTLSNVTIPWTKTIIIKGSHKPAGCGFTTNTNSNNYTANIYVNGKLIKTASSNSDATVTSVL